MRSRKPPNRQKRAVIRTAPNSLQSGLILSGCTRLLLLGGSLHGLFQGVNEGKAALQPFHCAQAQFYTGCVKAIGVEAEVSVLFMENELLRVGTAPHYGARVISLLDKKSGREWMTQGGESEQTGEDAVYSSKEAVAWDECFPTVGVWNGSATIWKRQLRDHGDLWGRPWKVERHTGTSLTLSYSAAEFSFSRELTLEGPMLVARYKLANLATDPLPYLWALHALLAVKEGDRIELPGVRTVKPTSLFLENAPPPTAELPWPDTGGALPFRLDHVQPPSTNFAGKFLISGLPGGRARIGQQGEWLEIAWDGSISDLGLWITYGAWPQRGGHYEVALEPTSAAADTLGQAIAAGAMPLQPGETRTWQASLSVKSG